MKIIERFEGYFAPAGRIIMGAFFVMAGVSKIMSFTDTANYISYAGFPAATLLAACAIAVEVGFGTALLIGYQARIAALALAGFVLFLTFPFHGPQHWAAESIQQTMFMKNIVIFGSLLFMAAHAGRFNVSKQKAQEVPVSTL